MQSQFFSWVKTHKQLVDYLKTQENNQPGLINLLKSVGIGPFNDKGENGDIELSEIDPFTFFFYINKYGSKRRLKYLQKIAEKLDLEIPSDDKGIPSAQAQKVWLYPYKRDRKNNEVARLWKFFHKAISGKLKNEDFEDALKIQSTGKVKLTEGLFNINPEKFLPINGPIKPYLKEVLDVNPNFNTLSEYLDLLEVIKSKTDSSFYEISFKAWDWKSNHKNGKPKHQDLKLVDYRKDFKVWINDNYPPNSGARSSYVKAIDILSKKIENSIFQITDDKFLEDLYKDLLIEQGKENGKYFHEEAQSYGNSKFYSASIKAYRKFLKSIKTGPSQIQSQPMDYPLNTIFYGPPGTGKTYKTILRAAEIIENRPIETYEEAQEIFNKNLHDKIEFITFHQNYSYEDFIQGLRPDIENDKELTFERKDGVFKIIADKALENIKEAKTPPVKKKSFEETFNLFIEPLIEGEVEEIEVKMKKVSYYITAITNKSIDFRKASGGTAHSLSIATLKRMYKAESDLEIQGLKSYYSPLLEELLTLGKDSTGRKEFIELQNYVIIIDEINRANISRVFGELITLIEPDKRSHGNTPLEARLPSGEPFKVPSNLYLIGTMNTADKSIALLDIALRRRFSFEPMYPQYKIENQKIHEPEILQKINEKIKDSKSHDFQIGHSYFMGENWSLVKNMNSKIIPLLMEYYMNDEKEVKEVLQNAKLKIVPDSWPIKILGTVD